MPRKFCAIASSAIIVSCPCVLVNSANAGDDPFADVVILYEAGTNPSPGYSDSSSALGSPERFTGEGIFPQIVSAFNAPWGTDEIVSIGAGGQLVLKFNTPVTDDVENPYGIDLLVFGNALFIDENWPNGHCGASATLLGEGGLIEVSPDGSNWTAVPSIEADGLFPTEGYLDLEDTYSAVPGNVEATFTRPVSPALSIGDFDGLNYSQVLAHYRGAGGGAGIDVGALGLSEISYVRISNAQGAFDSPEIDAVADVAPRKIGDCNGNGVIDVTDLFDLLAHWGPAAPAGWHCEFTGDDVIDVNDLFALLANWSS